MPLPTSINIGARRLGHAREFSPEDEQSILGRVGRTALGGIATVGNFLDLPGSMVRDVLSSVSQGKIVNPLDQLLSPFSPENRTTGRQLLRQTGMIGRRDTTGNWWGGLGAEIALDPLTYMTLGASALGKGGKVAKSAGLLDDVTRVAAKKAGKPLGAIGARQARLTTTLDDLLTHGAPGAREAAQDAAKGMGLPLDDLLSKPVGGTVGFGLPFMPPSGVIGTGKNAQKVAKFFDEFSLNPLNPGRRVLDMTIPGTNIAPIGAAYRSLNASIKEATTPLGRELARGLTRAQEAGRVKAREAIGDYTNRLVEMGKATGEQADELRRLFELPEARAAAPPEMRQLVDDVQSNLGRILEESEELGLPLRELTDPSIDYFPRYLSDSLQPSAAKTGGRAYSAFDPSQVERLEFLRGVQGGTTAVKRIAQDADLNELIMSGAKNKEIRQAIETKFPGVVPDENLKPFAKWLKGLSEPTRQAGVFGNHPIQDLAARLANGESSLAGARAVYEGLTEPNVIRKMTGPGDIGVKVNKIFEDAGFAVGKADEILAEKLGISPRSIQNLVVDPRIAADMQRFMKGFRSPEPAGDIARLFDSMTNLTKGFLTSPWPAFHTRNFTSGQFQNWVADMFSPRSVKDAHRMMRGGAIEGAADIPVVKQLAQQRGLANRYTPEFQEWIAQSVARTETGEPLRVFHGTQKEFDEFQNVTPDALGTHFGTAEGASARLTRDTAKGSGQQTVPAYIRVTNPLDLPDMGQRWSGTRMANALSERGILDEATAIDHGLAQGMIDEIPGKTAEQVREIIDHYARRRGGGELTQKVARELTEGLPSGRPPIEEMRRRIKQAQEHVAAGFRQKIQDAGYDGIRYVNDIEDATSTSWIVFDNDQIKRALAPDVVSRGVDMPQVVRNEGMFQFKRGGEDIGYIEFGPAGGENLPAQRMFSELVKPGEKVARTHGIHVESKLRGKGFGQHAYLEAMRQHGADWYYNSQTWPDATNTLLSLQKKGLVDLHWYRNAPGYGDEGGIHLVRLTDKGRKAAESGAVIKGDPAASRGFGDEQATRILGELAYAHDIVGRFQGEFANVAGGARPTGAGIEDIVNEMLGPGRQQVSAGRTAKRFFGAEPGSTLRPFKASYRGVGEATESTFGPMAAGQDVGHYVEGLNRLSPFIHQLKKGVSPKQAAAKIGAAQVNYANRFYTKSEQQVLNRMFPFYKFSSRMIPWTLQQLSERPGGKLGQTIRAANRARDPGEMLPDYVSETVSIPVADSLLEAILGTPPEGTNRYVAGLGLAFEDPLGFIGGGSQGTLLEAGSRLNPAFKGLLEWMTGESFFQKGPMGGRNLEDMDPLLGRIAANFTGRKEAYDLPDWLGGSLTEHAFANSPLSRVLSTVRTATDSRKGIGARVANLGTGFRITDVSPAAQDAVIGERSQALMRDLGAKNFSRTYFKDEDKAKMTPEDRRLAELLEGLMNLKAERRRARAKEK